MVDTHTEGISVASSMLVASVAGCVNVLCTNPMWVVITQLQALQKEHPDIARRASAVATAQQIWRDQGALGFFKGLWPSMVMVVNPTIQYILYEWMVARALDWRRRAAAVKGRKPRLGALDFFMLSACAKIGATLVTYPMLVVKNRLQVSCCSLSQTGIACRQ